MEDTKNIKFVFIAIKTIKGCSNSVAEKWLDENSDKINLSNVYNLKTAIVEVKDVIEKINK